MDDVQVLIYNELKAIRNDLKEYREDTDKRLSSLEKFRDKAIGVLIAVGVGIRYAWDYCKERIF